MSTVDTIKVYLNSRDRNSHHNTAKSTLSALEKINAHPKDDKVVFVEKGHKYFINGERTKISCTESVHLYFQDPDIDQMAISKMNGVDYRRGTCPEAGMSHEEILEYWSQLGNVSRELGTEMHSIIEFLLNARYLNNEKIFNLMGVNVEKELDMFEKFYDDFCKKSSFRPYRTEWLIYDENVGLAGSIDALFESKHDLPKVPNLVRCDNDFRQPKTKKRYWLFDWKRSKKIWMKSRSSDGRFCKVPGSKLQNCNFYHYALQLNIYRKIIESYNLDISGMVLIIIHPNYDEYQAMTVPFIDHESNYIIANGVDAKIAKRLATK
jgi:hypothetical protein